MVDIVRQIQQAAYGQSRSTTSSAQGAFSNLQNAALSRGSAIAKSQMAIYNTIGSTISNTAYNFADLAASNNQQDAQRDISEQLNLLGPELANVTDPEKHASIVEKRLNAAREVLSNTGIMKSDVRLALEQKINATQSGYLTANQKLIANKDAVDFQNTIYMDTSNIKNNKSINFDMVKSKLESSVLIMEKNLIDQGKSQPEIEQIRQQMAQKYLTSLIENTEIGGAQIAYEALMEKDQNNEYKNVPWINRADILENGKTAVGNQNYGRYSLKIENDAANNTVENPNIFNKRINADNYMTDEQKARLIQRQKSDWDSMQNKIKSSGRQQQAMQFLETPPEEYEQVLQHHISNPSFQSLSAEEQQEDLQYFRDSYAKNRPKLEDDPAMLMEMYPNKSRDEIYDHQKNIKIKKPKYLTNKEITDLNLIKSHLKQDELIQFDDGFHPAILNFAANTQGKNVSDPSFLSWWKQPENKKKILGQIKDRNLASSYGQNLWLDNQNNPNIVQVKNTLRKIADKQNKGEAILTEADFEQPRLKELQNRGVVGWMYRNISSKKADEFFKKVYAPYYRHTASSDFDNVDQDLFPDMEVIKDRTWYNNPEISLTEPLKKFKHNTKVDILYSSEKMDFSKSDLLGFLAQVQDPKRLTKLEPNLGRIETNSLNEALDNGKWVTDYENNAIKLITPIADDYGYIKDVELYSVKLTPTQSGKFVLPKELLKNSK